MSLIVAAFYKFVPLPDYQEKQTEIMPFCQEQGIKGTILLAEEGINGTIAGPREAIETVLTFLRSDSRFADLEYKESRTKTQPFERLKVKLKREIVTFGVPEANPSDRVGTYIDPQEWNAIITHPDVTVIDTRNDYEVDIGTFKGAENPQTRSFRDFPDYVRTHLDPEKQPKVAMFCTGGIRCEKATSYLLRQGFSKVYHLKGGILKYLEEIPPEESLWEGECFVFDDRIAVGHGLEQGHYEMCRSCGHPISEADKGSDRYQEGIFCPYCFESLTEEKRSRQQERQRQWEEKHE